MKSASAARLKLVGLVGLLASLAGCRAGVRASAEMRPREEEVVIERDAEKLLDGWLAAVDRAGGDYAAAAQLDSVGGAALADSHHWADWFFLPSASPHNAALRARHGFHVATLNTPDLLRHQYSADGLPLTVVESRAYVFVFVDRAGLEPLALDAGRRRVAIDRAARQVLNLDDSASAWYPHKWVFQFPPELAEGARFSTAPTVHPLNMANWTARADGGIHKGALFFLCYKKPEQTLGYPDEWDWFDPALRNKK